MCKFWTGVVVIMSFASVLAQHTTTGKTLIRSIERTSRKITNTEAAVLFNNKCIENNLLPKYTDVKLSNEAVRRSRITIDFRRNLVKNETEQKEKALNLLKNKLRREEEEFDRLEMTNDLRSSTKSALKRELSQHRRVTTNRIQKKLSNLYGGWMPLPEKKEGYINLSDLQLTEDQEELLNLGVNFQYSPRFSPEKKRAALEMLYQDAVKLKSQNKIEIDPEFQDLLIGESSKNRARGTRALPRRLRTAARELSENKSIVIRKADKSAVYVIMTRDDYNAKVSSILSDKSKFQPISRNPIEQLKKSANDLITSANKHITTGSKMSLITGEYAPGYFYGNPKMHKETQPLRPIISQIPLPTYQLAKHLNQVLTPYVPRTFSLSSPGEFIDLLRAKEKRGLLASLDVCNLFTNVPVERTIDILIEYAYHTQDMAPPEIPEYIMRAMLRLCTTRAPFRAPDGKLFYQIDGIAMGSPLGPLFAQAFMAQVEQTVFNSGTVTKPALYCRYVDDILVDVDGLDHLHLLKSQLEQISGLEFTIELSVDDKINFLDVSLDGSGGAFQTSVYRKATDMGRCLNGSSDCPQRYKESVVNAYVSRAIKHGSSWALVDSELSRVRQMLVNNNYPICMVDRCIRDAIAKHNKKQNEQEHTETDHSQNSVTHKLYYQNNMSQAYKDDEKALKTIVKRHCRPVSAGDTIKLVIFYRNPTTRSLVMHNNPTRDKSLLKQSNVIYSYKCSIGDCALRENAKYIGYTTTTLSRRITMHLQNGGPKTHTESHHNQRLTRKQMVDYTTIIDRSGNRRELHVLEAIHIRDKDPIINKQVNAKGVLMLFDGAPLGPRREHSSLPDRPPPRE